MVVRLCEEEIFSGRRMSNMVRNWKRASMNRENVDSEAGSSSNMNLVRLTPSV